MPHIARRKENARAYKTKLESEKGSSNAEIEVSWQVTCQNEKAESSG